MILLHCYISQGPLKYGLRAKYSQEAISSDPGSHSTRLQRHFVSNEKIMNLQKVGDLAECNISQKLHYVRCPALELLCNSLCGLRAERFGNP